MTSEIEQIKDRLDIVDLIGSYIKLEKAGRNLKARCPFHNEKTPSFIVSPERQSFYCFGCQAHGDIFSFVEKFEGLEFKEALKVLADRSGVELKQYQGKDKEAESKKERIFRALEEATKIYQKFLQNAPEQRKYFDGRGISEATIEKWRIGWAPLEWRTITNGLQDKGFTESELFSAGLIKKTLDNEKTYDVFRGRLMFPIFDVSGRVIAFSGRIFEDDGKSAKYINTPETELFKKSDVLYGINTAKSEIRRLDYSVLVEGQIDLILSHQVAVKNTVASSGTALTESHLRRIQKLSNRTIIAYDSDEAGRQAARRSGELALSLGMDVKIASLPEGEDPASLITVSPEKWKEVLKSSVNLVEFMVDESIRKTNKTTDLVKEITLSVIPLISSIGSHMLQGEMVKLVSRKTKISEKNIWADLEKHAVQDNGTPKGSTSIEPVTLGLEEMLAGIILWRPKQEGLTNNSFSFDEIERRSKELLGEENLREIVENSRFDKDTLIFETEKRLSGQDPWSAALDLLRRLEIRMLEGRLSENAKMLDTSLAAEDRKNFTLEIGKISKRINELNK